MDTVVWSLVLRRRPSAASAVLSTELASLVQDGRVIMIGPVRQEILSGIRERPHFDRLREHLRAFPDAEITSTDYEEAATLFNRCREKGIQGSNTDFLMCAVAARLQLSIFTTGADFEHFARVLPITLHQARA
ncbi:MAG: PIN domain-containing protein [Polyangiales bacterium]